MAHIFFFFLNKHSKLSLEQRKVYGRAKQREWWGVQVQKTQTPMAPFFQGGQGPDILQVLPSSPAEVKSSVHLQIPRQVWRVPGLSRSSKPSPATYSLTTITALASRSDRAGGTGSARSTRRSSRAGLTTVTLRGEGGKSGEPQPKRPSGSGCGAVVLGAAILPWGQENHLVRGILRHQVLPAGGGEVNISQGKGASGRGPNGHSEGTGVGLATTHLTSRLARGSSQSRGAHGTRGATFTTCSRRTLFAGFTLREKRESGQRWGGRGSYGPPHLSLLTLPPPSCILQVLQWSCPKVRGHSQRGQEDRGSLFLLSDRAGRPHHVVQQYPEVQECQERPAGRGADRSEMTPSGQGRRPPLWTPLEGVLTAGPSAPGAPFSPAGPGGPGGPTSPGRPAGPVSPRGPLLPSLPAGPGGPGGPAFPWTGRIGAVRVQQILEHS